MKRLCTVLVAAFLLVAGLRGAEYSIPSSRLPATGTWQAAGIPGGIPVRTTVYTTINTTGDSTDRTAEIEAALNSCPNGQVVLLGAGTFRCDSTIDLPYNRQVTLRGTVDSDGIPITTIDTRARDGIATVGFQFTSGSTTATVASLTKGATTLTVASSASFSNGELVLVRMGDVSDPPTYSLNANVQLRAQVAKIANSGGVPNSTTLVIDAPGLHGDYSTAPSATIVSAALKTTLCGIEDLIVDGSNTTLFAGIRLESAWQCWVKNVRVLDYYNYGMYMTVTHQCEIRRCWLEFENGYATSTVGLLTDMSSQTLLIDNVFKDSIFAFFTQAWVSGSVLAYNTFVTNRPDLTPQRYFTLMNSNHAPFNQFILFEGNISPQYKNDGYFGGTGYNTVFRNWLYGTEIAQTDYGQGAVINRLGRYENLVGNVMGHGTGGTGVSTGNPNISNGNSTGTVSMFGTKSVLTTRTSATAGTITAPSGHGVTTGASIDVYWMEVISGYNTARIRRNVTVGTVSGTSIPFSGGEGDDLPTASSEIYVPTSNSALWSYSLDWDSTLMRPRQWTGTLTTRTTDSSGIITLDSGMATTFNAALAVAANAQRHIAWPGSSGGTGYMTNVTGNDVTFDTFSAPLPIVGTVMTFYPSNAGMQELDLDVLLTTLLKGNYYHQSVGSGIPAVESLSGSTLPNSLFLTSTPSFFTEAGLAWPPVSTSSPPNASYEIIPSGMAYVNGFWTSDPTTVTTPQFSPAAGTYAAGQTLTITSGTSGATIYYTVDGSTPSTGSTVYSAPIALPTATTVVKAFGVKSMLTDSSVQSGTYVVVAAPTAPSSLTATAAISSQINLAWTDNSSTETGFRIERKVGAGAWSTVTTTAANVVSYSNTGLAASTAYDYRVYAINIAGDSAASNTASATTAAEGGGGGGGGGGAAGTTIQVLTTGTLVIP